MNIIDRPHTTPHEPLCDVALNMCASWSETSVALHPVCVQVDINLIASPHPTLYPNLPHPFSDVASSMHANWSELVNLCKSSKFVRVATHLTPSHCRGFRSHRQMAERDRTFQVREWCSFFRSEYYSEKNMWFVVLALLLGPFVWNPEVATHPRFFSLDPQDFIAWIMFGQWQLLGETGKMFSLDHVGRNRRCSWSLDHNEPQPSQLGRRGGMAQLSPSCRIWGEITPSLAGGQALEDLNRFPGLSCFERLSIWINIGTYLYTGSIINWFLADTIYVMCIASCWVNRIVEEPWFGSNLRHQAAKKVPEARFPCEAT